MVCYCCAYNCKIKAGAGYSFHKFPDDKKLRFAWCLAVRRQNFIVGKYTKLCSKHFKDDDFVKERTGFSYLKKDAVPSIFDYPSHIDPTPKAPRKTPIKQQRSSQEIESSDSECINDLPETNDWQNNVSLPKRKSYVGDFNEVDMQSPSDSAKFYAIATSKIKEQQKQIHTLKKSNSRLQSKVKSLKSLVDLNCWWTKSD